MSLFLFLLFILVNEIDTWKNVFLWVLSGHYLIFCGVFKCCFHLKFKNLNFYYLYVVECQNMERASLQNVRELAIQVEQVLGLLKVLVDHQFPMLAQKLNLVSFINYLLVTT